MALETVVRRAIGEDPFDGCKKMCRGRTLVSGALIARGASVMVRRRIARSAALLAAGLAALPGLTAACADCFLGIDGHLRDCRTKQPVAGATLSVHIDEGIHGPHPWPTTFTTDAAGRFDVITGGSETCDSDATLRFERAGYRPLVTQVKGTKRSIEVCMDPTAPDGAP